MTRATALKPPPRTVRRKPTKTEARPPRTFRAAINYLNSLTNYERATRVQYTPGNFGLAHMGRLLKALDNPQRRFATVHIAGTKGKGSTATMLYEMLRSCGIKTGLYTSPHVLDIRERICVDGHWISENDFSRYVFGVADLAKEAHVAEPTYFEVITAAAFDYFAAREVEVAVIETGMGGRLDATNVITPEVVGITSISFDHVAQLGTTLQAIAAEKAGIFKKGVPIISAPQKPEVQEVLRKAAQAAGATLRFSDEQADYSYRFEFSRAIGRHARICLTTPTSRFEHVPVPLPGEHQAVNCGVALGMLDILKSRGLAIDEQKATTGLADVKLPGRMQMIAEAPRILVDGAHNAASVDALMRAIGQNITYDSMVVIFGCFKDKDIEGMIRRIQVGADKVIFTSSGTPRSADPAELAAAYMEHSGKMAQVARTLDQAMMIARGAVSRDDLICITGSFQLVAEAIRKHTAKPA